MGCEWRELGGDMAGKPTAYSRVFFSFLFLLLIRNALPSRSETHTRLPAPLVRTHDGTHENHERGGIRRVEVFLSFLKTPPRVLFVALLRVLSYFEFFEKGKKKRGRKSREISQRGVVRLIFGSVSAVTAPGRWRGTCTGEGG